MRCFYKFFFVANVLIWMASNILVQMDIFEREWFTVKQNVGVAFFMTISLYLHVKPNAIRWFGKHLDKSSEANKIISNVLSLLVITGAVLFNSIPFFEYF